MPGNGTAIASSDEELAPARFVAVVLSAADEGCWAAGGLLDPDGALPVGDCDVGGRALKDVGIPPAGSASPSDNGIGAAESSGK